MKSNTLRYIYPVLAYFAIYIRCAGIALAVVLSGILLAQLGKKTMIK